VIHCNYYYTDVTNLYIVTWDFHLQLLILLLLNLRVIKLSLITIITKYYSHVFLIFEQLYCTRKEMCNAKKINNCWVVKKIYNIITFVKKQLQY